MSSYPPYGPMLPCQRCGSALLPNETLCRNCGYSNIFPSQPATYTPSPWNAPTPQTMPSTEQLSGQRWGQMPVQSPTNTAQNGSAPPRQFFGIPKPQANGVTNAPLSSPTGNLAGGNPPWGNHPPQVAFSQQSFYAAPPTITGGLQPGSSSPAYPDYQEEPEKKRPPIGLILGILLLLTVLVGGAFGYLYVTRPTTSSTPIPTTAVPNPTPSGPSLFTDTFSTNKNGWDTTSDPAGKFSVKVGNGSLVLEDDENQLLPELIPGGKSFGNFELAVDATLSKGTQNNGYGIFIRGAFDQNSDLSTYYCFELYGDSSFSIFKGVVDGSGKATRSVLVSNRLNSAIQKQGTINHIMLSAKGPTMTLLVNGHTLASVADSSYTSGIIALFVSNVINEPPGAAATFQNLGLYAAKG